MDPENKSALLGLHALTGNDYVSSFFRRGKEMEWKVVEKHNNFINMCNELGNAWFLDDATNKTLEEFVCLLYGKKSNKINVVSI